jgi:hypothetical protein
MRGLLPFFPSGTMVATAPDGAPPRRIGDKKLITISPPCLKRGPVAGVKPREMIFTVQGEPNRFIPDSPNPIFVGFEQ